MPPPADLWHRIEASTGAGSGDTVVQLSTVRRVRFWQATTAGSLALAAALAAFMLVRQPAPPLMAVLAPMTGGAPVLIATAGPAGALTVRPSGAVSVPSDRDLELWALAEGETKPRPLGVLPASGRRLTAALAPNTQLLVSLEPRGGSPTGLPTGPVLYGGRLLAVE